MDTSRTHFERTLINPSQRGEPSDLRPQRFIPSRFNQRVACAVQIIWRFANALLDLPEFQPIKVRLPHYPNGGAYAWQSLLAILIIAPLTGACSISHFLRKLDGDLALRQAFHLRTVPSASTMSRFKLHIFREEGFELLSLLFLTELYKQEVLTLEELTVDGTPIEASLNTARLRKLDPLPYELITQVFQAQDFSWVEDLTWSPYTTKYSAVTWLKICQGADFLGFYGLEAFRKTLKEDLQLQAALGLQTGVPGRLTLTNLKSRIHQQLWAQDRLQLPSQDLYSMLDDLARQLAINPQLPSNLITTPISRHQDLFNVFQTRPGVIDPTARFGYTASKKEVFIGYRWLIIGDVASGVPLCQYLGQPTPGEPYLYLQCLKKCQHVLNHLDPLKARRRGRIYLDGGLQDSKTTPYYPLLRLRPCVTRYENFKSLTPRWTKKRVRSEHLIARLKDYGGMRDHRSRYLDYLRVQSAIALCALQLNALCALEVNWPELRCSPRRLFS
ncbi:MAG: hypothetical protein ACFFC7_26045 [Candidatus Hermodarchaeota archaeon]